MFTIKHALKGNPFIHVFEVTSFSYQEFSPQEALRVMEEQNLHSRPIQSVILPDGETFLYPGDQMFIENQAGKTTVILR